MDIRCHLLIFPSLVAIVCRPIRVCAYQVISRFADDGRCRMFIMVPNRRRWGNDNNCRLFTQCYSSFLCSTAHAATQHIDDEVIHRQLRIINTRQLLQVFFCGSFFHSSCSRRCTRYTTVLLPLLPLSLCMVTQTFESCRVMSGPP